MSTRNDLVLSAVVVGAAAAVGYLLRWHRGTNRAAQTAANIGARIVGHQEIPDGATVVNVTSRQLGEIPGAKRAITRAIRTNAREEWAHVTLKRDGAWAVVDALRGSLPYYDGDAGEYNGVYVQYGDHVIVLDAIGWARPEAALS